MDTNDLEPESAGSAPGAAEAEAGIPRPSLLKWSRRGAVAGFKGVSYVIGPIAVVMLGLGLVMDQLGLWMGGSEDVLKLVFLAVGFYVVSALYGAIIGAVVGPIVGLIVRAWPGAFRWSWWGAFRRPIRLFGNGRDAAAPVAIAPSRFRLWHRLVIVPTVLMLAAAIGTGIYLRRVVEGRLAEAMAAADHDDPYWRLDDLMAHREPVPDAENSALVLAEVLARVPEEWPSAPRTPPGVPLLPPTEAWKAFARMHDRVENVRLDDATAEALRVELQARDPAVKIARTVAGYPRGRHELELGPTLIDTPLKEAQASRGVAQLLAADAVIRAQDGDLDGALDSCRAILGTARSIGDEPFAMAQLVRIAIGAMAMKSARLALAQGEPSDAALARLQSLILDELSQPLLLHALRGERAVLTELIRRLGAGEVPISALSEGGEKLHPVIVPRAAGAPAGRLRFAYQQALALEWMNAAVAIGRRPAAERPALWKAWEAEPMRVKGSWLGIYTATLPLLLMPALSSSSSAHSRYQCELGATAILMAAERHRRKAGDWPASIEAIDPSILPGAPVDPYSGRAFRMERRDGRLFIYSIGPNRKDEHGAYDPRKWTKGTTDDDVGAVGWDVSLRRQPHPPGDGPDRSKASP
jgi:hypothetical protein